MIDCKSVILQHFMSGENVNFRFITPAALPFGSEIPEIFKALPFSLRMFGLSRTIYVNYIHISCMISTITLIITAVVRATQMVEKKTSICPRIDFYSNFVLLESQDFLRACDVTHITNQGSCENDSICSAGPNTEHYTFFKSSSMK